MQQTHDSRLVLGRAGFNDRADENLQQTAADGVDHDGDQKSRKAVHDIGENRRTDESERTTDMSKQNGFPIAELLHVFGRNQVGQKLCDEIDRNEQCDLRQGNFVGFAERQKQKRGEIDDDRLRYISDKASENGVFVGKLFHR